MLKAKTFKTPVIATVDIKKQDIKLPKDYNAKMDLGFIETLRYEHNQFHFRTNPCIVVCDCAFPHNDVHAVDNPQAWFLILTIKSNHAFGTEENMKHYWKDNEYGNHVQPGDIFLINPRKAHWLSCPTSPRKNRWVGMSWDVVDKGDVHTILDTLNGVSMTDKSMLFDNVKRFVQ